MKDFLKDMFMKVALCQTDQIMTQFVLPEDIE